MARAKKSAARKRRARRIVTHAARVAAEELAAADGEELEDPENPFGEEEANVGNAPPLPPMTSEKPSAPPASIVALGPPPEDPLAAQAWLHRMVVLSAADAAIDREISAATRRREIRTIAATAAKLMPDTRRYEAEQTVLRARRNLEAKVRAKQGAKLRPIPGTIKAVPTRGDDDLPPATDPDA